MLREHFASFGDINQWVPLQVFGRIIIVYEIEHHAETAKRTCDPIRRRPPRRVSCQPTDCALRLSDSLILEPKSSCACTAPILIPIIMRGDNCWIPHTSYLKPASNREELPNFSARFPACGMGADQGGAAQHVAACRRSDQCIAQAAGFRRTPSVRATDGLRATSAVSACLSKIMMPGDSEFDIADEDWVHGETCPCQGQMAELCYRHAPVKS